MKRKYLYAIALSAASIGAAIGLLACSAWLISMASTKPPVLTLEVAIVAVRFFGLSRGVLKYASRIFEHDEALDSQTRLRERIYNSLLNLSTQEFGQARRGEFLQQLVADVDTAQDWSIRLWNPWFASLIAGTAGLGIVYFLLPSLALVLSLLFGIALASAPLLSLWIGSNKLGRDSEAELFHQILQSFEGVDESLVFNYQPKLLQEIALQQDSIAVIDRRAARWSGSVTSLYSACLGFSVMVSALLASTAYARGQLAGANVAVLILLPLAIFDGTSALPAAFARIWKVREARAAIAPLVKAQQAHAPSGMLLQNESAVIELLSLKPEREGVDIPHFSGVAAPGKPLIITGKSGIGKSSAIHAILGFIDFSGEILVNRVPVQKLEPTIFSVMLQDDYLFNTSVRENIKIGNPEASDREIIQMLEVVELAELMRKLPDGLDTVVGEYGFNFSVGEKQRMKLARVLLRNTPIFLLDEPFEYLEKHQAERLAKKVLKVLSLNTVIIVSHQAITPLNAGSQSEVVIRF